MAFDLKCMQNILSRPDGSAEYEEGKSAIVAAVYGPVGVKSQDELVQKATVKVQFSPKSVTQGVTGKVVEHFVSQTCESALLVAQHPRTGVTVTLKECNEGSCMLAACVNAACLALMNAAYPMKHLFAAVTCAITVENTINVNPDKETVKAAVAVMTFVFDGVNQKILSSKTDGCCSTDQYFQCAEICRKTSKKIFQFYRNCVKEDFCEELE